MFGWFNREKNVRYEVVVYNQGDDWIYRVEKTEKFNKISDAVFYVNHYDFYCPTYEQPKGKKKFELIKIVNTRRIIKTATGVY